MPRKTPVERLHVRLCKPSVDDYESVLRNLRNLVPYELKPDLDFSGRLYVSRPLQSPPSWVQFIESGIRQKLPKVVNRTNSAILFIDGRQRAFAFTFGAGRFHLRDELLEPDFGLRVALNALRTDSLQSLDSMTVEDQTIHTRSQASRASAIEAFGIDVSRDILRAVTGVPRQDVPLKALTGSGGTLAVSVRTRFDGLGSLVGLLWTLYGKTDYKKRGFAWVDNIQRVVDSMVIDELDQKLLRDLTRGEPTSYLAPPEPVDFDKVDEFDYTGRREPRDYEMRLPSYLAGVDPGGLTIETLKRHNVRAHGGGSPDPVHEWPVYRCLVFETDHRGRRFVLSAGDWFEVDAAFADGIRRTIAKIAKSPVNLPPATHRRSGLPETESDYNERVGEERETIAVMDKKVARCRGTSSGIEVCDLLTDDRELIHVKHKTGGSSKLSHMFAQGLMSAEALLGDDEFRQDARGYLKELRPSWQSRIPAGRPTPSRFRVTFGILGVGEAHPEREIPFFSQLNLARTSRAIGNLGYQVAIKGIPFA